MLKLNPKFHGTIDYLVIILLFLFPTLFHQLSSLTTRITYTLAEIHLVITLCTNFQLGIFKIITFKTLGRIELMVSFILIAIALYLGTEDNHQAQFFYLSAALIVFLNWRFTSYTSSGQKKILTR